MKKQSIWVFQWRKSVHYWWSYILFSPECKELASMLDPLLYRWGVPPVVIRCVHWTMQMWVLQTWIKALGLYIVMLWSFKPTKSRILTNVSYSLLLLLSMMFTFRESDFLHPPTPRYPTNQPLSQVNYIWVIGHPYGRNIAIFSMLVLINPLYTEMKMSSF